MSTLYGPLDRHFLRQAFAAAQIQGQHRDLCRLLLIAIIGHIQSWQTKVDLPSLLLFNSDLSACKCVIQNCLAP